MVFHVAGLDISDVIAVVHLVCLRLLEGQPLGEVAHVADESQLRWFDYLLSVVIHGISHYATLVFEVDNESSGDVTFRFSALAVIMASIIAAEISSFFIFLIGFDNSSN